MGYLKSTKSKANSKTIERLATYSAMAGALLLPGLGAHAEIIYTDVDPDETYNTDGDSYLLDLDDDGIIDFIVYVVNFSYPGLFYTSAGATYAGQFQDVFVFPNTANSVAGSSTGGGFAYPYALNSGDEIGAGLEFQSNSIQSMVYYLAVLDYPLPGSMTPFYSDGNWAGVTDKFLGLKFQSAGGTHYGWARLDCGADHHSFTIKDYAYETIADEPINAGEVPPPPVDISFAATGITVDESAGTATVTVTISASADVSVDVDINAGLTTATITDDFDLIDPSPVTFVDGGATTQSFTVTINEDLFDEADETIVLDLSSPVGGLLTEPDQFTITINDNDGPPGISYTTATATLNEDATIYTGSVFVDVTSDCSVDLTLNAGLTTATNGTDFDFSSPLTLAFTTGGATTIFFDIDVLEDADVETDETVVIDLGGVTGGCILDAPDQFTLTITNEDSPPPPVSTVSITEQHISYFESDGTITGTVELSETTDCTIDVVLEGTGSATEGDDFTFTDPTTINFTDGGATTATYDVNIIDDLESESTEIINFSLQNAAGNCEVDALAGTMMLHIIDNDEIGVEDIEGKAAIIYSFENTITVQILNTGWKTASFNLFDNTGQQVFNATDLIAENKFTMNDLPAGIYIAQLIIDGKSVEKNIYLGSK